MGSESLSLADLAYGLRRFEADRARLAQVLAAGNEEQQVDARIELAQVERWLDFIERQRRKPVDFRPSASEPGYWHIGARIDATDLLGVQVLHHVLVAHQHRRRLPRASDYHSTPASLRRAVRVTGHRWLQRRCPIVAGLALCTGWPGDGRITFTAPTSMPALLLEL